VRHLLPHVVVPTAAVSCPFDSQVAAAVVCGCQDDKQSPVSAAYVSLSSATRKGRNVRHLLPHVVVPHALVEVVCVCGGVLLTLWRLFAGLRAARKAMGHCISHVFWQTWAFPWRAAVHTNVGAAQTRLAATVGRPTLLPAGLLFFAHVFLNPPAFTG
jgi:hypothetical protein